MIAGILRKAGAEVVIAENGRIGVDRALEQSNAGAPFDVILMDMQMPEMDGYDAARCLRSEGYTGSIIALTANAMSSDAKKCLDSGCDDYASKPIRREDLIRKIKSRTRVLQNA